MIRITLSGRLGNCMFQYAVGRTLALRHRTDLVLDVSRLRRRTRRGLEHFGLIAALEPAWWQPTLLYRRTPTYTETGLAYSDRVLALPDGSWLQGLFQCSRYLADDWAVLRLELSPRLDRVRDRDIALERSVDGASAIAVHVRRGDYVQKSLFDVCTEAYYRTCMDRLRSEIPNAKFHVFSDDLAWCYANLSAPDVTIVDTRARPRAIFDLWLMCHCRHHIVANSTFSWWAAMLGAMPGQRVLVPERWFNEKAMSQIAMRDLVPASWERVPV